MNKIVEILMKRDNMTREEAESLAEEVRDEVLFADPFDAGDILLDRLCLEPDFLVDLF